MINKEHINAYKCDMCGISFVSTSFNAKHCPDCRKIKAKQVAHGAYVRQKEKKSL